MSLTHVGDEELECYLLGSLPTDEVSAIESHLIDCTSCKAKLSATAGFAFRLLKLSSRQIGSYEGNERSREHRIPTDDPAKMQTFNPFSPEKIPIKVTDVSRNGLKVHSPQFAEQGTIVQVVFKGAIIFGEVRYCVAAGAEFDAGIQIQNSPSKAAGLAGLNDLIWSSSVKTSSKKREGTPRDERLPLVKARKTPPQHDYRQFASLMRSLRARLPSSERSLAAVATRGGLKPGQLCGFETTRYRARPINRHTVDALASLYRATKEEKRELLVAAGHAYVAPTLREED
jgi:hypothetical protein